MIAILIPSFETVDAAIDYVEKHGEPVRICLLRGEDGKVRGNALVRPRP
jgi:hypothetical protein